MKIYCLSISLILMLSANVLAAPKVYSIDADDWARPRSGELIVEFNMLTELVHDWSKSDQQVIEIRYPGGDMGSLWAQELSDWLVTLGIPSGNIQQVSGSAAADRIELLIQE